MMPFSWAASRPSAICFAIARASSMGIGAAPQPLCKVLAFHQLQGEERAFSGSLEAVDVRDVRMIEGSEDLGLPAKTCHTLVIFCEGCGQDLDRHVATERRVFAR